MLSTVHRVKGMEWDRVIVAGVAEGVFPHRLAEDREEERRVMHVAITRCRQRVVVLADASRPSSFLGELSEEATRPATRRVATAPRTTPVATAPDPPVDLPPQAARTLEALQVWRRERARSDKVPAYIVAADTLLRAIALAHPTTREKLAQIKGIGPKKLTSTAPPSSRSCKV